MSLTKILSYEAEAEIFGAIHNVSYHHDVLSISGVSLDMASHILAALSVGRLRSAAPDGLFKPGANGTGPYHHAKPVEKSSELAPEVAPPPAVEAAAPAPPSPPEPVMPKPVTPANPEPPKQTPAAEPPPPQPSVPTDVPPEVLNAGRLKDVLIYFIERGCDSADKLLAECAKIKDQVPVLRALGNMEERVRRGAEAFLPQ